MSKVDVTVPAMGESISEATVGTLIAANGTQVRMDAELIELETDKVNQVLYAPQAGRVVYTVKEGDTVRIGQVIGHVDSAGAGAEAPAKPKEVAVAAATPPKSAAPKPAVAPAAAAAGKAIRKTAEGFLAGLNKETTPVVAVSTSKATPAQAAAAPRLADGERETRKRLPRIRQVIAERLLEAQHNAAMLTTFNEVDMTAVMALRTEQQERFVARHGVKLGFMSIFVRAVVSALRAVPALNSYIDGQELVQRHYYDIGIAVGTDRGLMVPVLRDCDQMGFGTIEKAIAQYAQNARDGTISLDDLQGGCFTVTNGGIYGSLLSTPILNPPQSGILGMHKIQKRPMVIGDQILVRPMMYLALSYDHRVVDGKEAVTFLVHVKDCIENPATMLLDL